MFFFSEWEYSWTHVIRMFWGFGNSFELDDFLNYRIFKSSVNRLNLFKVLIVSSTSFFQGYAICSLDSSSSFSSSSSIITSVGCSENSETIYSTEKSRDWLVRSRKCTSRNVELSGSFFVRSIFVKLFQWFILCFILCFQCFIQCFILFIKVTSLCFLFVVILNTINKQFSFMH